MTGKVLSIFVCQMSTVQTTGVWMKTYLDLQPLESETVAGVRVCVRVEARAEEEYPLLSRDRENSLPSWKSLFLIAS